MQRQTSSTAAADIRIVEKSHNKTIALISLRKCEPIAHDLVAINEYPLIKIFK